MKLLKPSWVSHDHGQSIFTIDIHPDGTRFATGGQTEDGAGKVIIWNMAPVLNLKAEQDPEVPKILSELTNHLGCVNCTRWSRDGKFLASGGDDSIIIIWTLRYKGHGKIAFGSDTPIHEHWGCVHMLRGHNGDILDLNWSHDQRYLASSSVDNSIIIWNALKFPEKVSIIEDHSGLVKGVAWDPVGKYLASQSDDKTLRVWRTGDWREEVKISKPFQNCGGTTHVLRLSWSPDGRFIVSAHSLNNDGPTSHIIDRNKWSTGMDFVGHRKAIEVVRFNPHLFVNYSDSTTSTSNHGCLAIGSRDRTLSVWLTSLKRPLVVIHELFTNSILDLSWSKDGYTLMACSLDGSIACVTFTKNELGKPLSQSAMDELYLELYGSKRLDHCGDRSTNALSHFIIEDPSMLSVNPNILNNDKGQEVIQTTPTKLLTTSSSNLPIVKQQVESRTPDGRRRIKPVMLTSEPSTNTSLSNSPFTASKIIATPPKTTPPKTTPNKENSKMEVDEIVKSPPVPISFAPLSPQPRPLSKLPTAVKASPGRSLAAAKALISGGGGDKRPHDADDGLTSSKSKRQKRTKTQQDVENTTKVTKTKTSNSLLESPELQSTLCLTTPTLLGGPLMIEVTNIGTTSGIVTCKREEESLWTLPLLSPGLVLVANERVTCIVLLDNTLVCVSTETGRLLLSRLLLTAPPFKIKLTNHFLLISTTDATLSVYDMSSLKVIIKGVSFSHMTSLNICDIILTKTGSPVVMTTNGAYTYHMSMGLWIEIKNSAENSEIYTSQFSLPTSGLLPLQYVQEGGHPFNDNPINKEGGESETMVYLESQLCRSLAMSSLVEYEHWSKTYVSYLVQRNYTERLREYCVSELGNDSSLSSLYYKQQIQSQVLSIIATNPKLQRLYAELNELFKNNS